MACKLTTQGSNNNIVVKRFDVNKDYKCKGMWNLHSHMGILIVEGRTPPSVVYRQSVPTGILIP